MLKTNESEALIGLEEGGDVHVRIRSEMVEIEGVQAMSCEQVRKDWKGLDVITKLRGQALSDSRGLREFEPASDRVILRPIDNEAFIKTKLHIPEAAKRTQSMHSMYKEMPLQGIVVAVGPGFMTDNGIMRQPGVGIGDHVAILVEGSMVSDFVYGGVLYYHCRSSAIMGKYSAASTQDWKYSLKFSE